MQEIQLLENSLPNIHYLLNTFFIPIFKLVSYNFEIFDFLL